MYMSVRSLLRALPCHRPSELPRFRSAVVDAVRQHPTSQLPASSSVNTVKEALFLLRAKQHLQELNERYFPQSGMSQKEVTEATAARVGLRMPKTFSEEVDTADGTIPSPSQSS